MWGWNFPQQSQLQGWIPVSKGEGGLTVGWEIFLLSFSSCCVSLPRSQSSVTVFQQIWSTRCVKAPSKETGCSFWSHVITIQSCGFSPPVFAGACSYRSHTQVHRKTESRCTHPAFRICMFLSTSSRMQNSTEARPGLRAAVSSEPDMCLCLSTHH